MRADCGRYAPHAYAARQRGITVLELVIGLSVFMGLLFGAFVFARSVRSDHLAGTVSNEVVMIAETAKRAWAQQPNFATLSNTALAPHMPRQLQNFRSAAGYDYAVYGVDYYDPMGMIFVQLNVPAELCAKLAAQTSPHVHYLAIWDGVQYHTPWYRSTMSRPDTAVIANACAGNTLRMFVWGVV